jgi:hypothetical protein
MKKLTDEELKKEIDEIEKEIISKWKYQYLSPAGGRVYYKKESIMIIYTSSIKLYGDVPYSNFIPAMASYCVVRKRLLK